MGARAGDRDGRGRAGGEIAIVPLRRNRDFQLLWGGQTVSLVGSQISKIAYPLLVLVMTGSPAKGGLAGFAAMLGYRRAAAMAAVAAGMAVTALAAAAVAPVRQAGSDRVAQPSSAAKAARSSR